MVDLARRSLFRSRKRIPQLSQQRLPWLINESTFTDQCTRCEKCIVLCETKIIVKGDGGFPIVDFQKGECTFCGECVSACPEPLFQPVSAKPWQHKISLADDACLARQSVECRSCGELCEPGAIRFQLTLGSVAQPKIEADECTGCGACVAVCPTQAIAIKLEEQE
ncbi:ferredoxin-type protein NapF [Vibrio sp. Of7-15]|uniref:ferredoxin-type protein NapF n=1 Tax=Vibrio sp. Of7-15 TaxID=2724879 RepID=UPI001EF312E2|nr:ferredoxin-type protein NapF [Vibrio sp. Of7-15]MCG7498443.1 ferredoxin-type protein NapF [Vibrio sp. Of7-15]